MNSSKISRVFLADRAHPLTGDPADAATWSGRLSNTTVGSGSVHPIRVIDIFEGERPIGTLNYITSLNGNSSQLDASDRSITFVDDDDSDAKYAFYRSLQCNGNVLMWYASGKHLYGGQDGIKSTIKPVYGIVKGADGGAHRWSVTISWRSECDEPRDELAI